MQEVGSNRENEEANKRKKQIRASFSKQRLKRAVFLSIGLCLVSVSAFALSPENGNVSDTKEKDTALSSDEKRKESCAVFLEQEFWESFGASDELKVSRSDRWEECRDIVSGKDVLVSDDKKELAEEIRSLTAGYPIESMAPFIAGFDREVAALIVGIAKKESNWGKRVPTDGNGQDCFNYWGYKGAGARGVEMGHGCFGSPEEAVQAVGNRLSYLVSLRETSDPRNMTIWKCGSSCTGHSQESVEKWISDVDLYYRKIVKS